MGESLNSREQSKSSEKNNEATSAEQQEKLKHTIEAGVGSKNKAKDSIEKIRDSIDAETKHQSGAADIAREKMSEQGAYTPTFLNKSMKKIAYKKELRKIRHNLKKSEKTFSKFIHNQAIETVSEIGAKTVARPSGILGGGLVALVGSSCYLWMSKNYGFSYNFFVFIILLIAGFFLGLLVEIIVKPLIKRR